MRGMESSARTLVPDSMADFRRKARTASWDIGLSRPASDCATSLRRSSITRFRPIAFRRAISSTGGSTRPAPISARLAFPPMRSGASPGFRCANFAGSRRGDAAMGDGRRAEAAIWRQAQSLDNRRRDRGILPPRTRREVDRGGERTYQAEAKLNSRHEGWPPSRDRVGRIPLPPIRRWIGGRRNSHSTRPGGACRARPSTRKAETGDSAPATAEGVPAPVQAHLPADPGSWSPGIRYCNSTHPESTRSCHCQ